MRQHQQDPKLTRQRLVDAAFHLYTTVGYRATTTPMLAERAGVAEGTIYRHFTGKAALLNEIYRDAHAVCTALLREQIARGLPARETLQQFGGKLAEVADHFPAKARLCLHDRALEYREYLDDASRAAANEFRGALCQVIASGKSDGMIRAGAADLWASVWLAVVAFVIERVCAREWSRDHPHVAMGFDAAWSAIQERTNGHDNDAR